MGAAGTGEGHHRMVEESDKGQTTFTPKPAEVASPYGKLARNLGFLAIWRLIFLGADSSQCNADFL